MMGHLPRVEWRWEMERGSRRGGLDVGGVASWGNRVCFECVCIPASHVQKSKYVLC
jgi:hypothetical protein